MCGAGSVANLPCLSACTPCTHTACTAAVHGCTGPVKTVHLVDEEGIEETWNFSGGKEFDQFCEGYGVIMAKAPDGMNKLMSWEALEDGKTYITDARLSDPYVSRLL